MSDDTGERECPYCRESIAPEATRCKHCKSDIAPEHGGTCPRCKEGIDPDASKCPHCQSHIGPRGSGLSGVSRQELLAVLSSQYEEESRGFRRPRDCLQQCLEFCDRYGLGMDCYLFCYERCGEISF